MNEDHEALLEEEPAINVLTQEEHLESILFQFVTLYERWSKDRKVAAKQGADIEKFVKEFASEVERFSRIENAVIEKLKKSLEHTTVTISESIRGSVSEAVNKTLDDAAYKIRDSARLAQNLFADYQSSLNLSHWRMIAITALSSIVASLLIVWWLMPTPTLPLTDAQIKTYQAGHFLESFWDKLSHRQQNWLGNLALGKTNNHEKLVEDAKKQYPAIDEKQANELAE